MQNLHANNTKPSIEDSKEYPSSIPNEHQEPNLNEKNQAKGSDEPHSSTHSNRKETGTQIDDQLEPGEINQPLKGVALPGSPKDANEDMQMIDSNPEEDSDEGASSSGLYSIPPKVPRGRKSKKKQREEATHLAVLEGSQKTLKGLMNTRSRKGANQASKEANPSSYYC